jgi:uncharacterized protein (TIGR00730 family)
VSRAVCVFCSSSERIDRRYVDLAAEVGAGIARRGWTLVSGGGSVSMMGAVAQATRAGGGHTVGVIPRVLVDAEVADAGADELLVTETMRERKAAMDERADAFLTLPGGIGTLEELLEIWVARSLGMHDKPVVVLDPDGVFAPLREQVDQLLHAGFVRSAAAGLLVWAGSADAALDACAAHPAPAPVPSEGEVLEAEP